jgi:hypothetical protein
MYYPVKLYETLILVKLCETLILVILSAAKNPRVECKL